MQGIETLFTFDLSSFVSIILIDIVMSGDNAIVIGLAASGLPPALRRQAILFGIAGATALRIVFAALTFQLLAILGLTLAGGVLLLWVAYRMWRELCAPRQAEAVTAEDAVGGSAGGAVVLGGPSRSQASSMRSALISIIIADVSMSLDNVLAVAGASHGYLGMLIFGLVLSIALMGFAATLIARVLDRYHWIAYVGIAIVTYVAGDMIWRGSHEVMTAVSQAAL